MTRDQLLDHFLDNRLHESDGREFRAGAGFVSDHQLWTAEPPTGEIVAEWWSEDMCIIYQPESMLGRAAMKRIEAAGLAWMESARSGSGRYRASWPLTTGGGYGE